MSTSASSTFPDMRVFAAEQFKRAITDTSSNTTLYLTFGKVDGWANDSLPNVSNTSVSTKYEVWSNMIGGKRLFGGDLHHVIPRYNWTSNTVYTSYDHTNPDLLNGNTQFYVMNSDYSVYKCLANANGTVSTSEPTSVNPEIVSITSDGYYWKYMYTLNDSEKLRFLTDDYIPVKTIALNDGSQQWQVQSDAVEGTIESIVLTNGGSGYVNISNVTIAVAGDGSGATATVTLNTSSNTVNSITITEAGSGYSFATVIIADAGLEGSGATARAIISPPGGHGSDPLYELGGRNILISGRIRYDEEGTFPVTNEVRQISLLESPYVYGSLPTGNVATNTAFLQAQTITLTGSGNYVADEIVYQGASLAASTYSARAVYWDSSNNKLTVINSTGDITAAAPLNGANSLIARTVSGTVDKDLADYSGKILYVDNIKPITRSSDQIEEFRILVKF